MHYCRYTFETWSRSSNVSTNTVSIFYVKNLITQPATSLRVLMCTLINCLLISLLVSLQFSWWIASCANHTCVGVRGLTLSAKITTCSIILSEVKGNMKIKLDNKSSEYFTNNPEMIQEIININFLHQSQDLWLMLSKTNGVQPDLVYIFRVKLNSCIVGLFQYERSYSQSRVNLLIKSAHLSRKMSPPSLNFKDWNKLSLLKSCPVPILVRVDHVLMKISLQKSLEGLKWSLYGEIFTHIA